jgi:hypothetical protein
MSLRRPVVLRDPRRRDDVLEQQIAVDRVDSAELPRLVVDHDQSRVLRRQQVIADGVAYRAADHGCTHEP